MPNVRINELPTTSEMSNNDYVATDGSQGTQKISYPNMASKVLDKLTTKTFSSLSTTQKNVPGAVNELKARVDNIVAPSGDPTLTELADIRVNFLGETFDTAGDAVRTSDMLASGFEELEYSVESVEDVKIAAINIERFVGGRIVFILNSAYNTLLPLNESGLIGLNNSATWTGAIQLDNDNSTSPTYPVSDYFYDYQEKVLSHATNTYRLLVSFSIREDIEYSYVGVIYVDAYSSDPKPDFMAYGGQATKTTAYFDTDNDGEVEIVYGSASDASRAMEAVNQAIEDMEDTLDAEIDGIKSVSGHILFTQTKTARNIVTDISVKQGDVIYCELLEWTGASFTKGQIIGVKAGQSNAVVGEIHAVGESGFFTSASDYDYISFALNATMPSAEQTLTVRLVNLSSIPDIPFLFKNIKTLNDKDATNFKLTATAATNYSTLTDADDAPVNTAIGIYNTSTPIANLPEQVGTLITYSYNRSADANFEVQFFFSTSNTFYHRIKANNSWKTWTRENSTLTRLPFSKIPLASSTYKIVLLGDSITQGQGSTGFVIYNHQDGGTTYSVRGNGPDYPSAGAGYQVGQYLYSADTRIWYEALSGKGWGQLLKAYLEDKFDCEVKNYGMSGISSGNLSGFLNDLVLSADFDCVILMIGTNDRNQTSSLSTFYSNVRTAALSILNSGKDLIIMAGTPASISSEESATYFHMEDVEHVLMRIASELNTPFISMYEEFMDYCDLKGITIDSLLTDGLHPNDDGYQVLFNIITKHIGLNRKRPGATW